MLAYPTDSGPLGNDFIHHRTGIAVISSFSFRGNFFYRCQKFIEFLPYHFMVIIAPCVTGYLIRLRSSSWGIIIESKGKNTLGRWHDELGVMAFVMVALHVGHHTVHSAFYPLIEVFYFVLKGIGRGNADFGKPCRESKFFDARCKGLRCHER